jgi:tetratricopeptide (TPR) repeat protein
MSGQGQLAQTVGSERAPRASAIAAAFGATDFGGAGARRSALLVSPFADSTARTMLHGYDWKGALESCRKVLEHDPDHLGALEVSAQALWFAGRYDEVVLTTNRLLMLNPLEPGYRYTRGMALMSMGHLVRAADDFRQAITQSDNPRFILQVQNALTAIEEYQRGGLDRIVRMKAVRLARKSGEYGLPSDENIH